MATVAQLQPGVHLCCVATFVVQDTFSSCAKSVLLLSQHHVSTVVIPTAVSTPLIDCFWTYPVQTWMDRQCAYWEVLIGSTYCRWLVRPAWQVSERVTSICICAGVLKLQLVSYTPHHALWIVWPCLIKCAYCVKPNTHSSHSRPAPQQLHGSHCHEVTLTSCVNHSMKCSTAQCNTAHHSTVH